MITTAPSTGRVRVAAGPLGRLGLAVLRHGRIATVVWLLVVTGERHGRSIVYELYDDHVAELLDQALYHAEHLRLGEAGRRGLSTSAQTAH